MKSNAELITEALDYFWEMWGVRVRSEIEPTSKPGVWRHKKVCHGECGLGHMGPKQHEIGYWEPREQDPARAWRAWVSAYGEGGK